MPEILKNKKNYLVICYGEGDPNNIWDSENLNPGLSEGISFNVFDTFLF